MRGEAVGGAFVTGPVSPAPPRERPLLEMAVIAGPSVATMTSHTVMQFADKQMIKDIGPEPVYVAAQGNGGILVWLVMAFALGALGVLNSFVSQNLGAGKPERGAGYTWTAMWLAVAWGAVVMIPASLLVGPMFRGLGHEGLLLELETSYARIVIAGSVFILLARTISHYFYGLHRPGVVLVSALVGNVINVYGNALLIFGETGPPEWVPGHQLVAGLAAMLDVPAMGIAGAAIATVVGGLVEFVIPLALFLSGRHNAQYASRRAWRPTAHDAKDLFRVGWPAGLMFVNELACWSLLMVVLVPAGAEAKAIAMGLDPDAVTLRREAANTAGFVALQYMHLSFMPAVGLSIATQALVGKTMGQGRPDAAAARTWLALRIAIIYMAVCAFVFMFWRDPLIGLFIDEQTPADQRALVISIGAKAMIAAAVFQVFDALAIVLSAALRGAGDTVWPGVATIVLSWLCIPAGGWALIVLTPDLGSVGPWVGASGYIVLLGVVLLLRFLGGRWRRFSLVEREGLHDLPPDEVTPGASAGMP